MSLAETQDDDASGNSSSESSQQSDDGLVSSSDNSSESSEESDDDNLRRENPPPPKKRKQSRNKIGPRDPYQQLHGQMITAANQLKKLEEQCEHVLLLYLHMIIVHTTGIMFPVYCPYQYLG